jgi:hypothetical protein
MRRSARFSSRSQRSAGHINADGSFPTRHAVQSRPATAQRRTGMKNEAIASEN